VMIVAAVALSPTRTALLAVAALRMMRDDFFVYIQGR
jgi:hypothetical protein